MLNELAPGSYALVAKVNVSNLDKSVDWYERILDLVEDRNFRFPTWRQLDVPGISCFAIGLNLGKPVGTGGAVTTFVVEDIQASYHVIKGRGVKITPPRQVEGGVWLSFFSDPDGSSLGLRQNPPEAPKPASIGWRADDQG